jgi:hypothetical protein
MAAARGFRSMSDWKEANLSQQREFRRLASNRATSDRDKERLQTLLRCLEGDYRNFIARA